MSATEGDVTIKTYRAASVADALSQVKKDLGPDAVILHTRNYKTGGVLGIGAQSVIEITATGDMKVSPRTPQRVPASRPPERPAPQAPSPASASSARPPKPVVVSAPLPRPAPVLASAGSAAVLDSFSPGVSDAGAMAALREEMASVKRMVGRMLNASLPRNGSAPATPDALQACYLQLLESEVAEEIAGEVASTIRGSLSARELADPEAVRRAALQGIAAYIPVAEPAPVLRPADGRPLTIALVGPTGVGKTTTLAKLAATHKLRAGMRVALVTSDTYRIAAVEQLRVYANIIGLPLKVALTPPEMAHACQSVRDHDVVLIDTAGRAPSDKGRLEELSKFMTAAMPHEVHLVLSSTSCQRVLTEVASRFSAVAPTHVIFTKLDEAVNFGVLVNVCRKLNARLSFVTTGQEVPDQIEPGDPMRIARLILDASIAAPASTGAAQQGVGKVA